MRVRQRDRALLRQLQTLYNLGTIGDLADGQLLERFATDADEVAELAFSALVERHEAMVWRVCLAIVCDEHEAEDAFQATFLVLIRKARSLWVRDSLGPWLHQVAYRTASRLRTSVIRRRKHEQRCAERDAARSVAVGTPRDPDREAAVHEEVSRLPEKYRAPVILCDLEGRTHQEAARFLGWPIGTVKSRQSKGRELIRDRMVRRGWRLAIAGAAVDSLRRAALAALPEGLVQSTVRAAVQPSARFLAGFGLPAYLLTLTQGVLRGVLWTRVRLLTITALAVGIASAGASVYLGGFQETPSKDEPPASQRPAITIAPTAQPRVSTKADAQPATATPQAMLRAQQLATRKARATYEIARLTRDLAEIAIEEYDEVIYPRQLAAVEKEIQRAESKLRQSREGHEWVRQLFEKKSITQPELIAAKVRLQQAAFSLEQARTWRKVLVESTRNTLSKDLRGEVEWLRSRERAEKGAWDREKAREIELGRQLGIETN